MAPKLPPLIILSAYPLQPSAVHVDCAQPTDGTTETQGNDTLAGVSSQEHLALLANKQLLREMGGVRASPLGENP